MQESRLLLPAMILVVFGLISVYSAGMPLAIAHYGDGLYFFRKQLFWVAAAAMACFAAAQVPLDTVRKYTPHLFFATVVFLFAMKIGGFASVRNGAARWVSLGPVSVQPSEFARLCFVLYLAKVLSGRLFEEKAGKSHYVGVVATAGLLILAVGAQPDFGGAALLCVVMMSLLFVSGAPFGLMTGMVGLASILAIEVILSSPYKRGRLLAFLDPWADAQVYGFQLIQSYLALGNGGIFGRGVGLGGQKLFYLPEAHTDFIVSVIGEELGLLGTLFLVAVVGWFLFEMYRICQRAAGERFRQFCAVGIMTCFGSAYLINLAVATGLLPTKGLALPLISYGGSALVASGLMVGVLCRIERETGRRACV